MIKSFKEFFAEFNGKIPEITNVIVPGDDQAVEVLNEGQWISGRFDRNIRIDQPTHLRGQGQAHAHVYGRKGQEIVAVNLDGTGSHGSRGRLHPDDVAALTKRNFSIPPDGLVEWWSLKNPVHVIFD